MTKILKIFYLLLAGMLAFSSSNAQLVFDHYKNYIYSGIDSITIEEYDMMYNVKRKRVIINAYTLPEENASPAGIIFKSKHLSRFYDAFKEGKNKYTEWKKIAMLRDVGNMEKNMPLSFKTDVYFKHNGETIVNTVKCRFKFVDSVVNGEKVFMLVFYSGPISRYLVKSSDGSTRTEWVPYFATGFASAMKITSALSESRELLYKFNGIGIVFPSESDIDKFLAKISPARLREVKKMKAQIKEKRRIKKEKRELFK